MRPVVILLTLLASSALAQGTPPASAQPPAAKAPESPAEAPESPAKENSTFTVRCMEDCSVRVDGKTGLRRDPRTWEFRDVAPGQRRVEVTGGFLNRPLYNGYADVPGGMKVTAQITSTKRLTLIESAPLAEQKEEKATGGAPSILTVRCPKKCTVSIDGQRKGAAQSQIVVARDIPPGEHNIEVKFIFGKDLRSVMTIPAASEVFITASDSGLAITNTKPLSP